MSLSFCWNGGDDVSGWKIEKFKIKLRGATLTKLVIVSDELDSDIRLFLPSRRMYDKFV